MTDHQLETFKAKVLDWVFPILIYKEYVAIRDKLPIAIKKTAGTWIYPLFDDARAAAGLRKIWLKGEGK